MDKRNIFISTTSYKKEELKSVLSTFKHLGWMNIDLNLHHLLNENDRSSVYKYIKENSFNIGFTSGGWCDFFFNESSFVDVEKSIRSQIEIVTSLGVNKIRLFLGKLSKNYYSSNNLDLVVKNINKILTSYENVFFSFENHDGVSLDPHIFLEIMQSFSSKNVGVTFDAINFERSSVNSIDAFEILSKFIYHIHVKGLTSNREYCEYGSGSYDFVPLFKKLRNIDYQGHFTLEYEGANDPTIRLNNSYQKLKRDLKPFFNI